MVGGDGIVEGGILALVLLGLTLGLRHGVDWDHLAAITDITSTKVTLQVPDHVHGSVATLDRHSHSHWEEGRAGFFLATLYALGHAAVVVVLGLFAIWASTLLPEWIDPIMERIVGATLVFLGVWVFYALWREGREFRLRSRWMLVFSAVRRGWAEAKARITGQPVEHFHDTSQYGPKTAFGVGMIHGVGAETGSQALLLAGAAGATTALAGTLMLLSFVFGLIVSNSLVAAFASFGFVSAQAKQNIYFGLGIVAGAFSLIVGVLFLTGQGAALPDLQELVNSIFGSVE
jgi:cytochrome c biogenesis protein CcdA